MYWYVSCLILFIDTKKVFFQFLCRISPVQHVASNLFRITFVTQLIHCDVRQHLVRLAGQSICTASRQNQINTICVCVWAILDIDLCQKIVFERMCKFTYLIRKYIAGDLVDNNVRIICEDVVQNRAVIFSWMEMRRKIRSMSLPIWHHRLKTHLNKSTSAACRMIPPWYLLLRPIKLPLNTLKVNFLFESALTQQCSNTSVALTFLFLTTQRFLVIRIRKIKFIQL